MSEPLRLAVDAFAGVPVLRLRGAFVFGQDLKAVHDTVTRLRSEGHERLVVDLTDVHATDSSGISTLLEIRKTIAETMILLRPSDRLRSALAVTRVTSLFEVVDDEAQLVRCIGDLRHDTPDERKGEETAQEAGDE